MDIEGGICAHYYNNFVFYYACSSWRLMGMIIHVAAIGN